MLSVILYNLPHNNKIYAVMDDDEEICVFNSMDDALNYTDTNKLFQSGQANFQIVELDDL